MQYEIETTEDFDDWLDGLRDRKAIQIIRKRIVRVSGGLFGNVEPVGEGVSEIKIDFGPGYRVYFKIAGKTLLVLLVGGDKSTQDRDIERAKAIAADLE
ncbi:addiction module antitoxin RelB [alpha proteobacterium AAP81b]|nr:addiction module antitoxin RelB [alpha proteobacterium AAP81b]